MRVWRLVATGVATIALAGVPAACGEDDVDRGADEVRQGAKDAEQGAKDAGREAEDEAGEAKKDVEKEIED